MRESNIFLGTLAERLALPGLCDLQRILTGRVAMFQRKGPDRNKFTVGYYLHARIATLAERGVYIGTSSWNYPGWLGIHVMAEEIFGLPALGLPE